ncbi:MAG TPA: sensor histidine kinase [Chloroflexota bacterium]|jgi:signal transduction histidine kinase
MRVNREETTAQATQVSRRELRQLKWLTALVPFTVLLIYEAARRETLEHVLPALPVEYGNLVVWILVLLVTYGFAIFVFGVVERLQAQALARGREVAALNAVVEERARLSRELHDGFAQLVAYLLVRIDTVEALVSGQRQSEAMAELERMRSVTDDLYEDVRESISELRTRVSERGLAATVREYVDAYEDRHDLTVHIDGDAAAEGLAPLVAFHLLRIIQEALANVRKHANAHNAWINFSKGADRFEMVIADDGQGFEPEAVPVDGSPRSFGLASMRERAASLNGEVTVDSRPGRGTRIVVAIPLKSTASGTEHGTLAPAAR